MDIDPPLSHPVVLPNQVDRWHRIAQVIDMLLGSQNEFDRTLIYEALPFLYEIPTVTEQRNELTRRLLRISLDPSLPPPAPHQAPGMYWLEILAIDHMAGGTIWAPHKDMEDSLQDLCHQLSGVTFSTQ